jgi:hypothetical protein
MRTRHVATLAALTGGLTAAAALHRRAGRRLPVRLPVATTPVAASRPALALVEDREGVVLPFVRPAVAEPAPEQPAAPARCRDTGGQTKAGAPCNARATVAGRCHHHRVAA